MKRLLNIFAILYAVACIAACSADYDTFGESDYNNFNDISFEEQAGDASIYPDEHIINVTLNAPKDSGSLDSVTVSRLKLSNMASLYIVESVFKEFPKDSLGLDSLARQVAYAEDKIKVDSKIYIPASKVLYLLVVSESGIPSIWKLTFTISGEEAPENPGSGDEPGDDPGESPGDLPGSSSSEVPLLSSSSEVVLSNQNNLDLVFKNFAGMGAAGEDTIFVKLKNDQTLETAELESYKVSDKASVTPKPDEVKEWKEFQDFVVTAEDGSKRTWCVKIAIAEADEVFSSEKELVSISAKGEIAAATKDAAKKTVTLHLSSRTAALKAEVSFEISNEAKASISNPATLDLTKEQKLSITAADGSKAEWTLKADFNPEPRLLSMKIDGKTAKIDSVVENGAWFRWVHVDELTFLQDLTKLPVSDLSLTKGATAQVVSTSKAFAAGNYDLSYGLKVRVTNGDESAEYEIRAGYQYPGSNFNTWTKDDYATVDGWDNGNNYFIQDLASKYTDGTATVLKMESKNVVKFASGNMFTAKFNPNEYPALLAGTTLTSFTEDGNELIDFGKPFKARPRYIEFDAKYNSVENDSCDMYILLENRTLTANEGKNQYRRSEDVNTLIASAWYRATKIVENATATTLNRPVPDLVSVKKAAAAGYFTVRLKLNYGEPLKNSPIENSSVYRTEVQLPGKSIDNHLVKTTAAKASAMPVTHIRIVMASSAAGNFYSGKAGAALYVDEIRLIY